MLRRQVDENTTPSQQGNSSKEKSEGLSIGANTLWNAVGSLFYLVCTWLMTVLVVIFSDDYQAAGSLAVGMAAGNIFASIVLYKVRTVQVADVEGRFSDGEFVALRIITTLAAIIICAIYAVATVAPYDYLAVAGYSAFRGVECFVDVFHGTDQRHNRLDYPGISQILRGVTTVVFFVIGMVVFKSLAVALALVAIAALAVVAIYDYPRTRKFAQLKPEWHKQHIIYLVKVCFPGFLAILIVTLIVSLTRQIFGLMYGNELLGIYATVATPTVIVQAMISYLYVPIIGPLAIQWQGRKLRDMAKLLAKFVLMFLGCLAILLIGFALFGDLFLSIVYGQDIVQYSYLFMPMICCTALVGLLTFMVDLLIILQSYFASAIATIAGLAATLIVMVPMFNAFGMNGINFTIIIGCGVGVVIAAVIALRKMLRARRV